MYNSLHDLLTSYWAVLSSDNDWEGSNLDDSNGDGDDDVDVARKMATLVDTASLTALGLSVMSENLTTLLQIDGKPMLPQSLMDILKAHFVDKKARDIPDHNSIGITSIIRKVVSMRRTMPAGDRGSTFECGLHNLRSRCYKVLADCLLFRNQIDFSFKFSNGCKSELEIDDKLCKEAIAKVLQGLLILRLGQDLDHKYGDGYALTPTPKCCFDMTSYCTSWALIKIHWCNNKKVYAAYQERRKDVIMKDDIFFEIHHLCEKALHWRQDCLHRIVISNEKSTRLLNQNTWEFECLLAKYYEEFLSWFASNENHRPLSDDSWFKVKTIDSEEGNTTELDVSRYDFLECMFSVWVKVIRWIEEAIELAVNLDKKASDRTSRHLPQDEVNWAHVVRMHAFIADQYHDVIVSTIARVERAAKDGIVRVVCMREDAVQDAKAECLKIENSASVELLTGWKIEFEAQMKSRDATISNQLLLKQRMIGLQLQMKLLDLSCLKLRKLIDSFNGKGFENRSSSRKIQVRTYEMMYQRVAEKDHQLLSSITTLLERAITDLTRCLLSEKCHHELSSFCIEAMEDSEINNLDCLEIFLFWRYMEVACAYLKAIEIERSVRVIKYDRGIYLRFKKDVATVIEVVNRNKKNKKKLLSLKDLELHCNKNVFGLIVPFILRIFNHVNPHSLRCHSVLFTDMSPSPPPATRSSFDSLYQIFFARNYESQEETHIERTIRRRFQHLYGLVVSPCVSDDTYDLARWNHLYNQRNDILCMEFGRQTYLEID
jgi:hypothetical protein